MKRVLSGALLASLLAGLGFAAPAKGGKDAGAGKGDDVLGPGYYSAKVGAIVCEGCKGLIEKTMRGAPGIGAAQVDEKAATVKFAVMEGKKVRLAELQKTLTAAADKMGMGADYTLSGVQALTAQPSGALPAKSPKQAEETPAGAMDHSAHDHPH